jgi:hypothetical protein
LVGLRISRHASSEYCRLLYSRCTFAARIGMCVHAYVLLLMLTLHILAPLGTPGEPEVEVVASFPEDNAFSRMFTRWMLKS